jgi:ribonucleoside-diphosphate reductase alpha chain
MIKTITKRDNSIESYMPAKLINWGEWGAKALPGRLDYWPDVITEVIKHFEGQENVHSQALQKTLISFLLQRGDWPSNKMAGRLYAASLHKELYGELLPTIRALHHKLIKVGLMETQPYSKEEYAALESVIDHNRDFDLAHSQIHQNRKKYALRPQTSKEEYETPQFIFMRMAMASAANEDKSIRLERVRSFYNQFSLAKINPPSPNYINFGTSHRGFSSCCLVKAVDSIDSLAIHDHIAYVMTGMSAGIGTTIHTRGPGEKVRGGAISHQGKHGYYQALGKATKANIQAGRGGACNTFFSAFDPEAMLLANEQSVLASDDKKNRDIKFTVNFNRLFAEKAARAESIFHFTPRTQPELWKLMHTGDKDGFRDLYNKIDNDPTVKKVYMDAREFVIYAGLKSNEVSTLHYGFIDEMNRHTPFDEPIYSSNLCVAPETLILTDRGHVTIAEYVNEKINVWNGSEFSEVTIRKTSDKSKLIKVLTAAGHELECTPHHKFYVVQNYNQPAVETRAIDLQEGDRLIKGDWPIISGVEELDNAYVNGFYSGDGCLTSQGQRIYLYGEKINLVSHFSNVGHWYRQPNENRIYGHYKGLKEKFFVPGTEYTIESRLKWLAGYADADGCIQRNGENQSLVLTSVTYEFLRELQLMLQYHGVSSKISLSRVAGQSLLPLNDGTGRSGFFNTQTSYRLLIASNELQLLMEQGLTFNRLLVKKHQPQRSSLHFDYVVGLEGKGREDATYCFTEPKRHLGVFNGILTGQCVEITEPTEGYEHMPDLYDTRDNGYIRFVDQTGFERKVAHSDKVVVWRDDKQKITYAGSLRLNDTIMESDTIFLDEGMPVVKQVLEHVPTSEVALCSLAAIPVCNINSDEEYFQAAYDSLKMIDYCIHRSTYKLPHIGWTAKNRMNAGVGMMGVSTVMARKGLKYGSPEGRAELHRLSERHAYFVISASLKIATERGNAPWIHKTKWPQGWLPIDTYNRNVDELTQEPLHYDWEELRTRIIAQGGIGHCAVIAHMPTESSSKASGVPRSVMPVEEISSKRSDSANVVDWVALDSDIIEYELAYEVEPIDMIKAYAVIQKFTDQGISADIFLDRNKKELKESNILDEFFAMVKYGMKTRYYQQTKSYELSDDEIGTHPAVIDLFARLGIPSPHMRDKSKLLSVLEPYDFPEVASAQTIDDLSIDFEEPKDDDGACSSGACSL